MKEVVEKLQAILAGGVSALPPRIESAFEPYSARGVACRYAALFDRMLGSTINNDEPFCSR